MAELVHLRLEHGLQELEEMQRIGLFNQVEIRKIAKKRKMHEYRLRRRNRKKEDFLQYIEFEIALLFLISKRRERLLLESKKKEIDNSIAKKINRLFKAAISRYPEDEKLWLNQVEYFKRMKWHDSINALYTKILQVHSDKPNLWILAAKWEMENNNSYDNARMIFQRAILMHPKSETIWHEYFRMELKYIELIKKRREILHLHNMEDDASENDSVLNGDIVNVVYDKAVDEIPDVEFALSFLNTTKEFNAVKNSDYILYDVHVRFPDNEETLDALAKQPLLHSEKRVEEGKSEGLTIKDVYNNIYDEIYSKYEEAVKALPTEKMWNLYLDFLFETLECCTKEKSKEKMEDMILSKLRIASSLNCLAEEFYHHWIDILLKKEDYKEVLRVSQSGAHKWKSSRLWLKCLQIHINYESRPKYILRLFLKEALSDIKGKESLPIWKMGINWLTISYSQGLTDFFEAGLNEEKEISVFIKEMYLESVAIRSGLSDTRNLYRRFRRMGEVSPEVIKKMIKLEQSQSNMPMNQLREYFEDGLNLFGADKIDVWLDYLRFETQYGKDPEAINMIQWRGRKTLNSHLVEEFQFRITNLLTEGINCSASVFSDTLNYLET